MRVGALLAALEGVGHLGARLHVGEGVDVSLLRGVDVTSVELDHRRVRPGALYCCLRGSAVDGHDLAPDAVEGGAVALLAERPLDLPRPVPVVVVRDTRAAMGPLAAAFYGHPSHHLSVVGITGTNGKTTTAHLLAHVLDACGVPCATIGTLSGGFTTPTTPEAPLLQAALARHRDEGARAVALEVSSLALVRHRVDATRFAVAAFTNLSQDHLDDHGTMEDYFAAKARLFTDHEVGAAVVGADGPWGARMVEVARSAGLDPVTFTAGDVAGGRFRGRALRVPLPGRHNLLNGAAAALCAVALGCDEADAVDALATAPPVPGRFEPVDLGQPFTVLVDYAHTPDALATALAEARAMARGGRVVAVVGCGGDRDPGKRAPMGRVASTLADLAVLTSDNPRSEDPAAILDQVAAGATGPAEVRRVQDRAAAIAAAVAEARPGDVVLIAGKGHETYQEAAGERRHFDDREEAGRALAALGHGGAR